MDNIQFFNKYPDFYETSETGNAPNRLNSRYQALIEWNNSIINDSSILDLGSHDGRWSFAAIKNGASFVLGIEARHHLIINSQKNMQKYGISLKKYSFIEGDVIEEIKKIKSESFDVIFCFGIFYHIMNHMLLLSEIKRLNPKFVIFDTLLSKSNLPIVEIRIEDSGLEKAGLGTKYDKTDNVLSGWPSKSALELMLEHSGFSYEYYNWKQANIKNWNNMKAYRDGFRLTLRVKNLDRES